ncbi:zinc ribbon domain-containing protein [Spiribacter sp. SSL99]|uniref:zinc ribbon domain-containing protein n=1 Tax=Spiribacter sp. SSL99 TaxID=1866884 RepID=UPI00351A0D09
MVAIDRFAPSTRQCSGCGHARAAMPLSTRRWQCPKCGAEHDRDINAAVNIERIALEQLPGGSGEVKRVESGRPRGEAA